MTNQYTLCHRVYIDIELHDSRCRLNGAIKSKPQTLSHANHPASMCILNSIPTPITVDLVRSTKYIIPK